MSAFNDITKNGFWKQNPLLVQLLGLCPLLAISTSLVNAVSLGLATILVMLLANFAVASLRALIPYEIRIPVFVLIIAALVTVVDLSFNAFLHDLYLVLGIFIPLIVTNCIVLARVEAFAAKNGLAAATLDGVMMGVGFLWVIALIGGLRELIGQGTLFSGIEMIFPALSGIQVLPLDYPGFLIMMLPPGAFFTLGLLIAGRNWSEARANQRRLNQLKQAEHPGDKPAENMPPFTA
ncbi:MAG: electron transport complex subunit E [Rugosibacter sp.]|nr:electron transport complex subunit E [Rugosibacter sp.]MDO9272500.1 electron transport complex subunit E [Rugosibacter sp.]